MNKPCKKKSCGCTDTGLTTPSPCPHDVHLCPDPDPCAETFADCCIIHDTDTIVDLNILKGDTLCNILQKLAIAIKNPICADPTLGCQSPLNLHTILIAPASIKVGWAPVGGFPLGLTVEYSVVGSFVWNVNPVLPDTATSDTIGVLTPNTDYYIRVGTGCGCYSVTIQVKTPNL
jgi:hypothetical protein